jgi:predicted nucleic acid-binding protein
MAQKTYYVDACIWLNLFKKEGDPNKGTPYWKITQNFLEKIMFSEDKIVYSGFILKEIKFKISEKDFIEKKEFLESEPKFSFVKATPDDYDLARKFEEEEEIKISFFDYLHVAISKRLNITLITRDKDLIAFAKKHIEVYRPEELIP